MAIKYRISQFGKSTIRYSFNEAYKVMLDRGLLKGDNGLLRISCDTLEEANTIINKKNFNAANMHLTTYYKGTKLFWCGEYWYDYEKYFTDDDTILNEFEFN